MKAGPRQLVCHRFDCDHLRRLGALLLKPAPDRVVVAHREVRGFDEGPGQVLVAALGVAAALVLAVGFVPAVHGAGVGGKVAGAGKAAHVAGLQSDGQRQGLADARDGVEGLEDLAVSRLLEDDALKLANLFVQAVHHGKVGLEGQGLLGQQRHGIDVGGLPALDLVALGMRAQVAGDEVLHAQDLTGALAHELAALPEQVTQGAFVARVDMPGGQDAQAQQVGQVAGVVEVPGVLEAVLLLDGAGVDQVNGKAGVLQAIDQPVPVVGGLDGNALNLAGVAAQGLLNLGVVVGKSLAEHDAIRFIQHAQHAVVAVQVNGCVQCFVGLLRGLARLIWKPNGRPVSGDRLPLG